MSMWLESEAATQERWGWGGWYGPVPPHSSPVSKSFQSSLPPRTRGARHTCGRPSSQLPSPQDSAAVSMRPCPPPPSPLSPPHPAAGCPGLQHEDPGRGPPHPTPNKHLSCVTSELAGRVWPLGPAGRCPGAEDRSHPPAERRAGAEVGARGYGQLPPLVGASLVALAGGGGAAAVSGCVGPRPRTEAGR